MGNNDINPMDSVGEEESQDRCNLLRGLRDRAERHARQSIEWYLAARRPKKRCARYTRALAIGFVGIAGIIPVLVGVEGFGFLHPAFSTVSLGIAGLLVAYDRFFGCSSAWMRYISTEHDIRQALHRFQYDMEALRLRWASGEPDIEQATAYLDRARRFILEVDRMIGAETKLWLGEFRDALEKIDSAMQERKGASSNAAKDSQVRPGIEEKQQVPPNGVRGHPPIA